jgi:thymidylate kinase
VTLQRSLTRGGPKFISFSGIDGAGKSTQILALYKQMRERGLRVRLIAFWNEIARLTRLRESTGHTIFKGDKGVGTPTAPINRRDKNVRSWPMTCLRLFLYFVDAVSARAAMKRARRSDADVVVFDRFVYDELANLTLSNPLIRVYVRMILAIVPRPHISFLLDADPAQARTRKPEYPIEFLHINRRSYLEMSELAGGMTVIAPQPIEEVKMEILRHARKHLPFEGAQPESGPEVHLSAECREPSNPDWPFTRPAVILTNSPERGDGGAITRI